MDMVDFFLDGNLLIQEAFHVARDAATASRTTLLATCHGLQALLAKATVAARDDGEGYLALIETNTTLTHGSDFTHNFFDFFSGAFGLKTALAQFLVEVDACALRTHIDLLVRLSIRVAQTLSPGVAGRAARRSEVLHGTLEARDRLLHTIRDEL